MMDLNMENVEDKVIKELKNKVIKELKKPVTRAWVVLEDMSMTSGTVNQMIYILLRVVVLEYSLFQFVQGGIDAVAEDEYSFQKSGFDKIEDAAYIFWLMTLITVVITLVEVFVRLAWTREEDYCLSQLKFNDLMATPVFRALRIGAIVLYVMVYVGAFMYSMSAESDGMSESDDNSESNSTDLMTVLGATLLPFGVILYTVDSIFKYYKTHLTHEGFNAVYPNYYRGVDKKNRVVSGLINGEFPFIHYKSRPTILQELSTVALGRHVKPVSPGAKAVWGDDDDGSAENSSAPTPTPTPTNPTDAGEGLGNGDENGASVASDAV